ncbi:TetR/AcrR family transcriptional regulator [Paenibacillus sp. 19GGS1-52]|uniref:TetR/AcrR family transcriptional regulator n=1 Tax=Paenibacillus sp. 19GGS1-52 TaxID=2758563 RepID=UPI001EFA8F0D|nr:TetR/AcrR family transcriptional regulator [Paenibacillus sp. 19GGS1-52]ULO09373.1 TetR/AcrR family transcriptional regulator [Paenibacillus sp. 19GGS1-52]
MNRPKQYNPVLTKENILEQAKQLFSKKGYAATTISDICRATGVSKGSIYHHFKNKEDLFISLAEHSFGNSWKDWDIKSSAYTSVIDKLYAYSDLFVDNLERPLTKAGEDFINSVGMESEIGQRFYTIVTGYIERFELLITEGIERGELVSEDPKELAFIILSYFSGLSDNLQFMDKEAMKPRFRKAVHLLLEGIRQRQE